MFKMIKLEKKLIKEILKVMNFGGVLNAKKEHLKKLKNIFGYVNVDIMKMKQEREERKYRENTEKNYND